MLSTFFAARPGGALLCLWTRTPRLTRQRLLALHRAPACGMLAKPDGRHLVLIWVDDAIARAQVRYALHGHADLIDWPGRLVVEDWVLWFGQPHTVRAGDPLTVDIPAWLRQLQDAELALCAPS